MEVDDNRIQPHVGTSFGSMALVMLTVQVEFAGVPFTVIHSPEASAPAKIEDVWAIQTSMFEVCCE